MAMDTLGGVRRCKRRLLSDGDTGQVLLRTCSGPPANLKCPPADLQPPPANLQRPLLIYHGPLMTCGTLLMTCGAPPVDLWWPLPTPADLKPADLKHLLSHTSSHFTQRQTS